MSEDTNMPRKDDYRWGRAQRKLGGPDLTHDSKRKVKDGLRHLAEQARVLNLDFLLFLNSVLSNQLSLSVVGMPHNIERYGTFAANLSDFIGSNDLSPRNLKQILGQRLSVVTPGQTAALALHVAAEQVLALVANSKSAPTELPPGFFTQQRKARLILESLPKSERSEFQKIIARLWPLIATLCLLVACGSIEGLPVDGGQAEATDQSPTATLVATEEKPTATPTREPTPTPVPIQNIEPTPANDALDKVRNEKAKLGDSDDLFDGAEMVIQELAKTIKEDLGSDEHLLVGVYYIYDEASEQIVDIIIVGHDTSSEGGIIYVKPDKEEGFQTIHQNSLIESGIISDPSNPVGKQRIYIGWDPDTTTWGLLAIDDKGKDEQIAVLRDGVLTIKEEHRDIFNIPDLPESLHNGITTAIDPTTGEINLYDRSGNNLTPTQPGYTLVEGEWKRDGVDVEAVREYVEGLGMEGVEFRDNNDGTVTISHDGIRGKVDVVVVKLDDEGNMFLEHTSSINQTRTFNLDQFQVEEAEMDDPRLVIIGDPLEQVAKATEEGRVLPENNTPSFRFSPQNKGWTQLADWAHHKVRSESNNDIEGVSVVFGESFSPPGLEGVTHAALSPGFDKTLVELKEMIISKLKNSPRITISSGNSQEENSGLLRVADLGGEDLYIDPEQEIMFFFTATNSPEYPYYQTPKDIGNTTKLWVKSGPNNELQIFASVEQLSENRAFNVLLYRIITQFIISQYLENKAETPPSHFDYDDHGSQQWVFHAIDTDLSSLLLTRDDNGQAVGGVLTVQRGPISN